MSLFADARSLPLAKIHGLGDQMARKDAKKSYQVFRDLTDWWLTRLIRAGATGQLPPLVFEEEGPILQKCMQLGSIGRWMEIRDNFKAMLSKTEAPANLDRKQVIVSAFLSLETMLQGR